MSGLYGLEDRVSELERRSAHLEKLLAKHLSAAISLMPQPQREAKSNSSVKSPEIQSSI